MRSGIPGHIFQYCDSSLVLDNVRESQIFSIYLHRIISGFLVNTLHFGTDSITQAMISRSV